MLKMKVNGKWDFEKDSKKSSTEKDAAYDLVEIKPGVFHLIMENKSYFAELLETDASRKKFIFRVNGNRYEVDVHDRYDELLHTLGMDKIEATKIKDLIAPMPGLVLEVKVKEGQVVEKGDAMVVLEAMKMENILKYPSSGKVKQILVAKGDKVEKNQVLVKMGE